MVCYVKAALPRVLELFNVHFKYVRDSGSAQAVVSIQNLILNIYSQHCIPSLDEQLEVCTHSHSVLGKVPFKSNALPYWCVTFCHMGWACLFVLLLLKNAKVIFLAIVKAFSHTKSEINKHQAKGSASAPYCITLLVT